MGHGVKKQSVLEIRLLSGDSDQQDDVIDAEDAKKWRLKQAEELVRLFKEDTGFARHVSGSPQVVDSSARGKFVVERRGKLLRRKDHSKN